MSCYLFIYLLHTHYIYYSQYKYITIYANRLFKMSVEHKNIQLAL